MTIVVYVCVCVCVCVCILYPVSIASGYSGCYDSIFVSCQLNRASV